MGWSLGSNDSANIFGTAVYSKTIRYRTAVILCAVFVIIGALLEGQRGMHTLSGLVEQTADSAFAAALAAALTVTIMTIFKLPVSTSQAMVGAIIGIGIFRGDVSFTGLTKVVLCWIGTPVGTVITTLILYPLLARIINRLPINIFTRDYILKIGLLTAGSYGAYALGANNVANVTGVYIETGQLSVFMAALIGGMSIALGAVTYSKNVMLTVGKKLVKLDPYSAFITVFTSALVVHFYAKVGVPVSTSQAIIGSVLGIGLLKGVQTINIKTLLSILFGWLGTPLIALILAFVLYLVIYS
ncbi:Sulfate permease CysP [subsurface metagenome]